MNTTAYMRHEDYDGLAFKALQKGELSLSESERGLLHGYSGESEERDIGYQSGAGGLFIAPLAVDSVAQTVLTEANIFRKLGRVITTNSHTVATPMAIALPTGSVAEYSHATGASLFTPDTALQFGLVNHGTTSTPAYHPIGIVTNRVTIRVSRELLEDSEYGGVDVVEQIAVSGAMALAEQEVNVFYNGAAINGGTILTGSMGCITWSQADSARNVTVGTGAITAVDQLEMVTELEARYSENATLLLAPALYANFTGVSSSTLPRQTNWYGIPVIFSTRWAGYEEGQTQGIIGDFRHFVVADHVSGFMIKRYDEIAAGTGQIVFTVQKRFGGGITNDAAFRGIIL